MYITHTYNVVQSYIINIHLRVIGLHIDLCPVKIVVYYMPLKYLSPVVTNNAHEVCLIFLISRRLCRILSVERLCNMERAQAYGVHVADQWVLTAERWETYTSANTIWSSFRIGLYRSYPIDEWRQCYIYRSSIREDEIIIASFKCLHM